MKAVDTKALTDLKRDLRKGAEAGLRAATERGAELVRDEAPERGGRLRRGVRPRVNAPAMRGEVEASAVRPAQPARTERVTLRGGRTKEVKFRAQESYDYAEAVAGGTGLYGARGQMIRPKGAKRLRFTGRGGGAVYAGSVEGQRPNPYHERAADRLEREAAELVAGEVGKAVGS